MVGTGEDAVGEISKGRSKVRQIDPFPGGIKKDYLPHHGGHYIRVLFFPYLRTTRVSRQISLKAVFLVGFRLVKHSAKHPR